MKSDHVTYQFVEWQEGRMSRVRRVEVESHLQKCDSCRRSYKEAERLFDARSLKFLSHLSPDPFLPTRIRAHAENRPRRADGRAPWYQWALTSMGIAAAIWIGVQLGSGLSEDPASLTDEELASAYYQAFSQDETETNTEESSSAGEEQWQ
jgi:predicted anti-sigma-YlaC factor YlaD